MRSEGSPKTDSIYFELIPTLERPQIHMEPRRGPHNLLRIQSYPYERSRGGADRCAVNGITSYSLKRRKPIAEAPKKSTPLFSSVRFSATILANEYRQRSSELVRDSK